MKAYVKLDSNNSVYEYATCNLDGTFNEVFQEDSIINFDKLQAYTVVFDDESQTNHLKYDEEKYNQYLEDQKKKQAISEGNKLAEELAQKSILDNATDEEAYVMRYKYEEWKPKTKYEVNDRRRYGDNLYKCKQAHTSEEGPDRTLDRTPDKLPALWDIVNGDPSKGTKENPIVIPEPFSSMVYTYGLYYLENDILYQCERGGVPDPESMYGQEISLTYKPSQLVGHYFKVVE